MQNYEPPDTPDRKKATFYIYSHLLQPDRYSFLSGIYCKSKAVIEPEIEEKRQVF